MGKATNPARARRQNASAALAKHGTIERVNGIDYNHGGTPLTRWKATKQLSSTQELAIEHMLRLWDLAGIKGAPVTAGYGERIGGAGQCDPAWRSAMILDAQDDLRRIEARYPKPYWQIFENCIRHDEPAGCAGSSIMGWGNKTATARALTVVQLVADQIYMDERLIA